MSTRARGLTLLEMVLVTAILAALALAAVESIEAVDFRSRVADTQTRARAVRSAIVGHADRTVNGEPDLAGFVADMGRLPDDLAELTAQGALAAFDSSIACGWRGPYLAGASPDGTYPDGWSNLPVPGVTNARDFGWSLLRPTDELELRTLGSDGKVGGGAWHEQDVSLERLVLADWSVASETIAVTVTFRSATSTTPASNARVRILYPAALGAGPATLTAYASTARSIVLDTPLTFTFPAGANLPIGTRWLDVVDDANNPLGANPRAALVIAPRSTPTVRITWFVP